MNWFNTENADAAWAARVKQETKAWVATQDYEE